MPSVKIKNSSIKVVFSYNDCIILTPIFENSKFYNFVVFNWKKHYLTNLYLIIRKINSI